MDLKLTGRSVLITGASKGIGLGVAKWFAGEGVHPCLVARSGDVLEKEADGIRKSAQVNARTLAADLSDPAARRKVFETFPDVDIVINNAGAIPGGTIEDVDEKSWRAGWDLKIYAHVDFTRLYLARMKARNTETDRFEQQHIAFHETLRHAFLKLAQNEPQRFFVVDASREQKEVRHNVEIIARGLIEAASA